MGGSSSKGPIKYSVPVTEPIKGETAIYRNINYSDKLISVFEDGSKTIQEVWIKAFNQYSNKKFLGHRPRISPTELKKEYSWESFSQIEELTKAFGSGLINSNMVVEKSDYQNYKLKFVALYAQNSREWILADAANTLYGFTSIPIYDTLGEEAVEYMFNQTELSVCLLSSNHIAGMIERINAGKFPHLKFLVILDEWNLETNDELQKLLDNLSIKWLKFTEVLEQGRTNIQPLPTVVPEDIALFSYTSGTTGLPKGAMISHKNLVAAVAGTQKVVPFGEEMVHLSYLPLAHVFERLLLTYVLSVKGKYGLFNGNIKRIKEDLALLKPTVFCSVPRLFNKFYDKIQAGLRETEGCIGSIAAKAIKVKRANLKENGSYTHWMYDKMVFKKMKNILGGNCTYVLTGSAPISQEVMNFLKVAFCVPFCEGYGQTEGTGGSFLTAPEENTPGIVGGPIPHNEFKLKDVPEMKYFSTDRDEQGRLAPRGEILVRGDIVIPGYYKNPEKTAEAITSDGWLQSGDIGMIVPETGALKLIDRKKNIFKLSQGEYIAPDKLEQVYKTARLVADIFVYGDSLKSTLIAFVNPDPEEYQGLAKEFGLPDGIDFKSFCESEEANKFVMEELLRINKKEKLKGFEKIKKVKLEHEMFADHGLVTTTFKLKRNAAKNHFKVQIDEMYETLH